MAYSENVERTSEDPGIKNFDQMRSDAVNNAAVSMGPGVASSVASSFGAPKSSDDSSAIEMLASGVKNSKFGIAAVVYTSNASSSPTSFPGQQSGGKKGAHMDIHMNAKNATSTPVSKFGKHGAFPTSFSDRRAAAALMRKQDPKKAANENLVMAVNNTGMSTTSFSSPTWSVSPYQAKFAPAMDTLKKDLASIDNLQKNPSAARLTADLKVGSNAAESYVANNIDKPAVQQAVKNAYSIK